ncbi:MAG TPA: type I 3-dehydroquinate dehydratase [Bacteroidota bacterium]|nr:type I 3-dehydroquinate dehydratase [Bacteroidota bacterium]
MNICPSISAHSTAALRRLLSGHSGRGIAELRIDGMAYPRFDRLLEKPRPRVIVTNRRRSEGGKFDGSFRTQCEILKAALDAGAEYADIEFSWGKQALTGFLNAVPRTRVVLSSHNFRSTPSSLIPLYRNMRALRPGIIKIAVMADEPASNGPIFDVLRLARRDRQPMIALAMGEYGTPSRILAGIFGGWLSYSTPAGAYATAAGQVDHESMIRLYRAGRIDRQTRIFGLAGYPVSHSRGIYFHNRVFQRRHLNAVYINFPASEPDSFLRVFGPLITGASVTMPLKESVLPLLGIVSDDAREVSAVNTILRRAGRLLGENTDLPALTSLLGRGGRGGKSMIVAGTGAMARTAVTAGLRNGFSVAVTGRNELRGKNISKRYGVPFIPFRYRTRREYDVIVNATPVGMEGVTERRLFPPGYFAEGMLVVDAVYKKGTTRLIAEAALAGAGTIDGNRIFEAQAKLQSNMFVEAI